MLLYAVDEASAPVFHQRGPLSAEQQRAAATEAKTCLAFSTAAVQQASNVTSEGRGNRVKLPSLDGGLVGQ